MNFKGIVRKHIAPVVLAASIGGSILAASPVVAHAESYEESVVSLEEEKTKFSTFFLTKDEAENWIRDRAIILNEGYKITKAKIYLYKGIISDTEVVPIDEKYDNKEDALERLNELEEDEYYASDIELKEIDNDLVVTYNLVGRIFRTVRSDRYQAEIRYIRKTKEEIISEQKDNVNEINEQVKNPKTSDDSNIDVYSMMLMGSTMGLIYMRQKVKRKTIR